MGVDGDAGFWCAADVLGDAGVGAVGDGLVCGVVVGAEVVEGGVEAA